MTKSSSLFKGCNYQIFSHFFYKLLAIKIHEKKFLPFHDEQFWALKIQVRRIQIRTSSSLTSFWPFSNVNQESSQQVEMSVWYEITRLFVIGKVADIPQNVHAHRVLEIKTIYVSQTFLTVFICGGKSVFQCFHMS